MLTLSLEVPASLDAIDSTEFPWQDYQTRVIGACEILSRTDCRVRMGGFGKADWRLDVAYDLSTIIEQLPDVLAGIRSGLEVELDMYSQGVECVLHFRPVDHKLLVHCTSGTTWTPNPAMMELEQGYVVGLFEALAKDFAGALAMAAPAMAKLSPFKEWREGLL